MRRPQKWRWEQDSNLRYRFRYNGFQDRRVKPLCHPTKRSMHIITNGNGNVNLICSGSG